MDQFRSHKNLLVWQRSIVFAGKVYAATRTLPSEEHATLRDELRRGAVMLASKISEGHARKSRTNFLRCLETASSVLAEMETQITIGIEQKYLADTSLTSDLEEISTLLSALIKIITTARQLAHAKACTPSRYSRPTIG